MTIASKGNPKRDEDDGDSSDEEVDSDADSESDSSHFSDTEIREYDDSMSDNWTMILYV